MPQSSDGTRNSEGLQKEPTWFRMQIEFGLEHLARLRLRGTPTTEAERNDTIAGMALQLWNARTWDVDADGPKLHRTFVQLGNRCQFWPTVATILQEFGERTQLLSELPTQEREALRAQGLLSSKQLALPAPMQPSENPRVAMIQQALRWLPTSRHKLNFLNRCRGATDEEVTQLCADAAAMYGGTNGSNGTTATTPQGHPDR